MTGAFRFPRFSVSANIFETAKLAGIDPKAYLRRVVHAILMGEPIRLPHEIAAAATA